MEECVSRVLNELRGTSFGQSDKSALQNVVMDYFFEEEEEVEFDPPNGTAHNKQ